MTERPFDVVVYGATGFTGGLVAEYLARSAALPPSRWAIAGRNDAKLAAVRARLEAIDSACAEVGTIRADGDEPESIRAMAAQTRVLVTTVGPYAKYGDPAVAACVDERTDYLDLTGEPHWWRSVIERYHPRARELGIRLIPCSGFDSIPHDLGVLYTLDVLSETGTLDDEVTIDGYVAAKGSASGGTWASALQHFAEMPLLPRRKSGGSQDRSSRRGPSWKPSGLHRSGDVDAWVVPMPTIDPLVVRRSSELSSDYPEAFAYHHYWQPRDLKMMAAVGAGAGLATLGAKMRPTRALLQRLKPQGQGPTEAQREAAWFRVTFVGRAAGRRVVTQVRGGDPGYGDTSKMLAESALALALDRERLADACGVVTPASGIGRVLIERLRRAGMAFETLEQ